MAKRSQHSYRRSLWPSGPSQLSSRPNRNWRGGSRPNGDSTGVGQKPNTRTRALRGFAGHTHLAYPAPGSGRYRGDRLNMLPKSWNFSMRSYYRNAVELGRVNHHAIINQNHIKQGTLPKGIADPTKTFAVQFRPVGSSPQLDEALHVSATLPRNKIYR